MAAVRLEDSVFKDWRFPALAHRLGRSVRWVWGTMAQLYSECTERNTETLPIAMIDTIGAQDDVAELGAAIVECELAERVKDSPTLRIKGCRDANGDSRIDWLARKRAGSARGGEANKERHRGASGEPSGSLRGASGEPPGSPPSPAPAPAPAPAPSLDPPPSVEGFAASPRDDGPPLAAGSSKPVTDAGAQRAPAGVRPCCGAPKDPTNRVLAVEHRFCQLHRQHLGLPYPHVYARDRKALKNLQADYDAETLLRLVEQFFVERDSFIFGQRGASIPAFVGKISAMLAPRAPPDIAARNGNGRGPSASQIWQHALELEELEKRRPS